MSNTIETKQNQMNTTTMKLKDIKLNPSNPRVIKDNKFKQLVKSIHEFPEMLSIRPIVVNEDMVVLGGNMRLRACQEAKLKEVPVIVASELTSEQQRQFIIKDNIGYGEWDFELLANEWDMNELAEWGLDIPKFPEENTPDDLSDNIEQQFRIEIILNSEEEQEELFNELTKQGHTCRILTL